MTAKETFVGILEAWGATQGAKAGSLALDAQDSVSVELDGMVGEIAYREASDVVILWFTCGEPHDTAFFRNLLEANDRLEWTRGFTLAFSMRAGTVVVHDRRDVERLDSVAALHAWLKAGCEVAQDVTLAMQTGVTVQNQEV